MAQEEAAGGCCGCGCLIFILALMGGCVASCGDSGGDYILCAGNPEKGLVQMLQVRAAHTGLTAHFFNRPTALRAMVNLRSQLIQHLETGSLFGMNIIVLKFVFDPIEKNSSQVGQNISLVFGEIAVEFRLDCV